MTRRRKILGVVLALATVGGAAGVFHGGCSSAPPVSGRLRSTEFRSQRLTALAAEEAALIAEVDTRLTRQLNLADTQIARGWTRDARTTLAATTATLESKDAAQLRSHARISGWVSVSELSRRVKDNVMALSACESAVKQMKAIDDQARRCDYVMGIANELQYLKGQEAATALLAEAGPWTRAIDDLPQRRQAVVAFASALFNLDDYSAGQKMLRQDDEPAWRSEMLVSLATPPAPGALVRDARQLEASDKPLRESSHAIGQSYYGKRLDYNSIFENQKNSQTGKD